jgi:hypothetical protein
MPNTRWSTKIGKALAREMLGDAAADGLGVSAIVAGRNVFILADGALE